MSFGFGSGNTGSTFGGFGSTNNNNTTNTTGGSLFGGNTSTSGGFGSGGATGGFGGGSTSNPFGQSQNKTGFGSPAPATGGMFGSTAGASTAGGFGGGATGGFGSTNNAASTGFGGANTSGGGLFGQNKPATGGFGSAPAATSGGGMFGSSNTGGGFGATNTTAQSNPFGGSTAGASNPFGAAATNTGFGASNTANTGSGFAFGAAGASAPGAATQGTAATPFQPFTEKDGAGSSSTSAYQSITMQQPYQNKSFEELRVEDYLQNRKLPQSGSFGGATGGSTFGGFGQNNAAATPAAGGGLFGAGNTSTTGGFGATNTATTGFGANANTGTGFGASNTGGGLFGAAKPATGGGLFGNNAASSGTATGGFGATSGSGGGLFGNAQAQSNTGSGFGGGFGAGASSSNTSGGGLFGAQNNQTQNKPTFGGFGASNTATTGGFGQANNTAQQPQQGGGLFGAGNTANTGSSLFGAQQNKPAGGGLFGTANTGATNTGGGLFGNNNNTNSQQGTGFGQSTGNTGGGLFGGANNTQNNAGGSLFGNNQAKPATGGLFGASNAGTNTTGGLFGNNNNQQQGANAGGSLFGNNNNQQQQNAGGSLFGGQQNKPAGGTLFGNSTGGGGSLFGNNQTQNQGSMFGGNNANQGSGNSLFGGNNQNQSQGAGSSLFGGNQQQQQQQQNQLTATLTGDPYGNAQLFSSLAAPSPPVGPLATPLSGAKAPQRPRTSLLSSVRGGAPMLGASQSMTPRTRPGYGFSYSSYNSPASGLQNLTPGAAGLLRPTGSLGSSLSGRLSKSFSTSNLRGDAPEGHTLLRTPAAGQSSLLLGNGNGSMGSGSARKLKIDRSLRTDLFGETAPKQKQIEAAKEQDPALRKRVSFDRSAEDNAAKLTTANSPVARHDEDITPTGSPEPKHTNGNGLDSVPEESITPKTSATASPKSKRVVEGGDYWTSPSIKQLQSMSRQQLQNIGTFTVGRHNLGRVEFGREGGVDLSTVPLERICGELVRIEYRHCTVYGDDQEKPPMGEGLNVPSTIHLEQSWPRATRSSGVTPQVAAKAVEKHRRGLSQVKDTEFVEYDASTGIWTFKVEHFTTYGFDESDDENDFEDGTDMMDLQPKIPTPLRNISNGHPEASKPQRSEESEDSDMDSPDLGEPEDTFEFKLSRRSHQDDLNVPGGFDGLDSKSRSTFEHDDARTNELYQDEHNMSGGLGDSYMDDPFIEAGGAVPASNTESRARYNSSVMDDDEESDQEVPGSYRAEPLPPRSILKPSAHMRSFASPEKVAELPWEEQLQRTMSPKKRDRQALKDMQGSLAHAQRDGNSIESPLKKMLFSRSQLGQSHLAVKGAKKNATGFSASTIGAQDFGKSQAFTTGMDLINSLWGQTTKESKARDTTAEMPYPSKRRRESASNMNENDTAFHDSFKPSFSGHNALVYSVPGSTPQISGDMQQAIKSLVSEGRDVRFAKFTAFEDIDSGSFELQKRYTELQQKDSEQVEVPLAIAPAELTFTMLAQAQTGASPLEVQEKSIWELCSILFDPLDVCAGDLIQGMSDDQIAEYEPRLRLDRLQIFWTRLIAPVVDSRIKLTRSAEEKAFLLLTKGDVITACQLLMDTGDVKLATMVAQLPCSETSREIMKQQIQMWQARKDWSEFSDAHRALYSVLAGENCVVSGLAGASEDRTQQFCLSERFGLDWRQSLALDMQFGGHESIVNAISSYTANLKDGKEKVKPLSSDVNSDAENTLLGLLRMYALKEARVEHLFDSATISGSALNSRLAWQLATVLEAKDLCDLSEEKMDALTLDFASQLECAGAWTKAAWTLLHLSEPNSRTIAIQGVLERNAAQLPSPDLDHDNTLIEDDSDWSLSSIAIPTSLIWEAKAVYAHAVLREPALQAKWLLYTCTEEAFAEAHTVLCSIVGPRAVIEKDYTDLIDLLACFDAHGAQEFGGWKHGGKIYADFVHLIALNQKQKTSRDGRNTCWVLRKGLESAQQDELVGNNSSRSLEVRVAMGEIFRVLGEVEREIGINARYSFDDAMEVDGVAERGGKGLLEGYRKALGVVV